VSCPVDEFQARVDAANAACCDQGTGSCDSGVPGTCDALCALTYLDFYSSCRRILNVAVAPEQAAAYDRLYDTCGSLPAEDLLLALSGASCSADSAPAPVDCPPPPPPPPYNPFGPPPPPPTNPFGAPPPPPRPPPPPPPGCPGGPALPAPPPTGGINCLFGPCGSVRPNPFGPPPPPPPNPFGPPPPPACPPTDPFCTPPPPPTGQTCFGTPPAVQNGQWRVQAGTATLLCNPSYSGSATVQCAGSTWATNPFGSPPQCVAAGGR
jgi:hypothetical protein